MFYMYIVKFQEIAFTAINSVNIRLWSMQVVEKQLYYIRETAYGVAATFDQVLKAENCRVALIGKGPF